MKTTKQILLLLILSLSVLAQDSNLSNMYRLAKSFEQAGQFEQAKAIYEDIYKAQPFNTTFLEALNNIYVLLKDYDKSIELMTQKIQSTPENVNYYGILGNTYYTKGDTAKAFETWEQAFDVSQGNAVVYRVVINYALENRAFKKAIEYLERGKALNNSNDIFSLDLGRVYAMTMNFEKAAFEFCEVIKNDPTKTQMVIGTMSSFLSRPNALDETIKAVEEYKEGNNVPDIYKVLIHLYQLDDDFENAFKYVQSLEDEFDLNGREYFKFAQLALNEEEYSVASQSYQSLIDKYPNSPLVPPSRIGFARTYEQSINAKRDSLLQNWKPYNKKEVLLKSEYRKAINSYKKINELYPNGDIRTEALFHIAEIYFDKLNNLDSAYILFNQIQNSRSTSNYILESAIYSAKIHLQKNEIQKAETILREVLKNPRLLEEYRSEVNLLLGKIYFWQAQFEHAAKTLSEVTTNLMDDNANDALQILTLIGTLKSDSLNLAAYAKADLEAYKTNYKQAAAEFDNLRSGQNPIIKELAGYKYAQVLVAEDNYNEALDVLRNTEENSTLNMFGAEIEFLRGEIKLFAIKDYEGALEAYRNILENYSNSLYFDKSRQKIEYINQIKNKTI